MPAVAARIRTAPVAPSSSTASPKAPYPTTTRPARSATPSGRTRALLVLEEQPQPAHGKGTAPEAAQCIEEKDAEHGLPCLRPLAALGSAEVFVQEGRDAFQRLAAEEGR